MLAHWDDRRKIVIDRRDQSTVCKAIRGFWDGSFKDTGGSGCGMVINVRGALLAKGPDFSLGEVHRGSCSEDIHMEEEKVEVKVQEDEVEDGRDK